MGLGMIFLKFIGDIGRDIGYTRYCIGFGVIFIIGIRRYNG